MPTEQSTDRYPTMEPTIRPALTAQSATRIQSTRCSTRAVICACALIARWSTGMAESTAVRAHCVVHRFATSSAPTSREYNQRGAREQDDDKQANNWFLVRRVKCCCNTESSPARTHAQPIRLGTPNTKIRQKFIFKTKTIFELLMSILIGAASVCCVTMFDPLWLLNWCLRKRKVNKKNPKTQEKMSKLLKILVIQLDYH